MRIAVFSNKPYYRQVLDEALLSILTGTFTCTDQTDAGEQNDHERTNQIYKLTK
jgi:hypothetical protein